MSGGREAGASRDKRPRIVAGFGRSGTTWIQDVLARSNRLRPVFEPLHPVHVAGAREFAYRYLDATTDAPELYAFLDPFFNGRYPPRWADFRIVSTHPARSASNLASFSGLRRYLRSQAEVIRSVIEFAPQRLHRNRIVKFVRANMMLGWLSARFDARIVFVIRHPAAVILSQMGAPKTWNPRKRIQGYRSDERLLENITDPLRSMLFRKHDDVEAYAVSWCLENSVALAQAARHGIHVVHYENLLNDPTVAWSGVMKALGLSTSPDESLIRQPSQQAWGEKAKDPELVRRYDSWMNDIDASVADGIQRVMDEIGLGIYRMSGAEPVSTG